MLYVQRTVKNGLATFSGVLPIKAGVNFQLNVSSDSIPVRDSATPGPPIT